MKPHFRKPLYLPNDEDPPNLPLRTPFSSAAANPPSASIGDPLRPPLTNPPFDSSVGLTVLVLLTALFFMGFFSLYIRRFAEGAEAAAASRRARRPLRRGGPRRPSPPHAPPGGRPPCSAARKGLDPAVIRSLPAFAYGGGGAKYQAECAVCLSDFEEEEVVKAIPRCSHVFHADCIDRWLCAHVSCPVCRDARLMEAARSASELGGGSTAASGDTCPEIGSGGGGGGSGARRSSSWSSSLAWEGHSLERTMSF